MPPTLSVIMPVHNSETMVGDAVDSILNSDFKDFEFLIVDDHCTDRTMDRVTERKDARIRILHSPKKGVVHAMNTGIRESKCRFIARMDADDISPKTRFSSQLSFMENTAMDGVGLCVRIVNEQGDSVPSMQRYQNWINGLQTSEDISAYRFVELPLVNPTMTVKREVFEREFLDGDWPEDYDFWLRAMAAGYRFAKLPDPLYYWRDHPHRLTRSDARYSNEAFDRCRLKHLINGPLKNQRQIDLWGVGQTGKPWLRRLQQKGYEIRRAIDVNPRKIGTEIHGVQVISPSHLPPTDGTPLVIAVGAAKAREQISEFLLPRNYKAGINAWFVA